MKVKKIIIYCAILNIIFIPLYHYFLKRAFLSYAENKELFYDRSYYFDVFSNIETSGLLVAFILLLLLAFFDKIKLFFICVTPRRALFWGITILVLIQVIISFYIKTNPISDSSIYIDHGIRIKEIGVFSDNTSKVTNFWPVGLPFLISMFIEIFGDYQIPMKLINIFISIGMLLIIYYLFEKELNRAELSFIVIVYVLFPANWFIVNIILTDYIFLFLTWLIILLLVKGAQNLYANIFIGFITGLAIYFKSIALLFPLLILVHFLFSSNYKKALLQFCLILSLAIFIQLPWIIRNYNYFDEIILTSTNGGFNFLMGNHINSPGKINFDFYYDLTNPNELIESERAYQEGIKQITENQIESIIRIPKKIIYSYYRGDVSLTWSLKDTLNKIPGSVLSFLFYLTNFLFYCILFFAFIGFWKSYRLVKSNPLKLITVIFFIYFHLIIIIFVGNERYLIPLYPMYFFYFVLGLDLGKREYYENHK